MCRIGFGLGFGGFVVGGLSFRRFWFCCIVYNEHLLSYCVVWLWVDVYFGGFCLVFVVFTLFLSLRVV